MTEMDIARRSVCAAEKASRGRGAALKPDQRLDIHILGFFFNFAANASHLLHLEL